MLKWEKIESKKVCENHKNILRERILTLLRNQKENERLAKSLIILDKLFNLQEIKNCIIIMFYASYDGEVETNEMIKKALQLGKKVALPRIVGKNYSMIPTLVEYLEEDLEMGPYGIKQPKENLKSIDIQDLDAIIVPGISFDKNNYRLGRGKGYYDRFLAKLPSIIPTIGVAFDFQIVDSIPRTKHDVPVSRIIIN